MTTTTRLLRIALVALLPLFTLGALAAGCGDDTTTAPPDMAATVHDMAKAPVDMANTD